MKYNPDKQHRRSICLQGYDYSQPGIYFVTLCTHNREYLFGEIFDGEMRLNEFGKMTQQCWLEISDHFPHVKLDEFAIMPNHIHGRIILDDIIPGSIASIIRGFKIGVTKGFKILNPDNTDIYAV
jgi:REP element-mobilizing transposase RayT